MTEEDKSTHKEVARRLGEGEVGGAFRDSGSGNFAVREYAERRLSQFSAPLKEIAQALVMATPAELLYIRQALDGVLPSQASIEKVREVKAKRGTGHE